MREWRAAPLDPRERAMAEFAHHLTVAVGEQRAQHLEALRAVGLDDLAILHVVEVVAYFNFVNRLAEGLGVELEPARRA